MDHAGEPRKLTPSGAPRSELEVFIQGYGLVRKAGVGLSNQKKYLLQRNRKAENQDFKLV